MNKIPLFFGMSEVVKKNKEVFNFLKISTTVFRLNTFASQLLDFEEK